MRAVRLAVAVCILAACDRRAPRAARAPEPPSRVAQIPHRSEPAARHRLPYYPTEGPLAWPRRDTLVIAHVESYWYADMLDRGCDGSGFYAVAIAEGMVRPLAVGSPACDMLGWFTRVGDASISRDGGAAVARIEGAPPANVLVRLDIATGRVDTLAHGAAIFWSGRLSPDGERIAFAAEDPTVRTPGIYVVRVSDGVRHRLPIEETRRVVHLAWSDDGTRLALVQELEVGSARGLAIVVVDTTGAHRRVIARGAAPAWSRDGRWIAYLPDPFTSDSSTIRVVRSDGGDDHEVFRNHGRAVVPVGFSPTTEGVAVGPLVWSPDGRWLAFAREGIGGRALWRVDVETGELRQITRPAHR